MQAAAARVRCHKADELDKYGALFGAAILGRRLGYEEFGIFVGPDIVGRVALDVPMVAVDDRGTDQPALVIANTGTFATVTSRTGRLRSGLPRGRGNRVAIG